MHSHLHTRREVKTRCGGPSHRWLLKTAWVCSCSCCSSSVHTFSEIMTPYYWVWMKMLKGLIVKGCEKALGMRYPLTLYNWIQLDRTGMHETLQASITCTYCINISTWCSGSPKGMDFLTKFWNKDEIIIRLLRYVMSVCGQHTWCFHFKHAKYVWRIIEIFIG